MATASATADRVSMVLSLKESQELHSRSLFSPAMVASPASPGKLMIHYRWKETPPSIKTRKLRGHPALKTLHGATVVYSKGRGRGPRTAFTTPEGRYLPKHEAVALISSPNR